MSPFLLRHAANRRVELVAALLLSLCICSRSQAAEPGFEVIAKAQPDEFYHGLGGTYYPLGAQPPGLQGQPKVNGSYVWSMVRAGDDVWFGTAANPVAAALGGIAGVPIPRETAYNAFEFWKSRYPGIPALLRIYLGDWRPPEIYRLRPDGSLEDRTPDHPLVQETLGMRAAGASDDVVLIGGPHLSQIGVNLFAFDARTGAFLSARRLVEFSNIRRWLQVDGVLYTSTLDTFTLTGSGSVLRWTGSASDPFAYEVVGQLDNDGASLCYHDGRLYAFTWSTLSRAVEVLFGARSQQPSGVWMSPELPANGLTAADRWRWKKVWSIAEYDPDPVITRSVWMGAAASHDGHLVWGTIQVPGYGAQMLKDRYGWPANPLEVPTAVLNSFRPATLFRGRLDQNGSFKTELLYGDATLPVYASQAGSGIWTQAPNKLGPPRLGSAGMGDRFNMYVWSMLPRNGRLWIGTFDMSFIFYGNDYVLGRPIPEGLGGDLLVMDATDQPARAVSREGFGNLVNNGARDLLDDGERGILIGTATSANLLTDPNGPTQLGGWEVVRFDPNQAQEVPVGNEDRTAGVDWQRWATRIFGLQP